jgi:hypothetical protein
VLCGNMNQEIVHVGEQEARGKSPKGGWVEISLKFLGIQAFSTREGATGTFSLIAKSEQTQRVTID